MAKVTQLKARWDANQGCPTSENVSVVLSHCFGAVQGKLCRLVCVAEGSVSSYFPWPVHPAADCSTEGCPLCPASLVLRMDNLIGRINQGT